MSRWPTRTLEARFWQKVDRRGDTECWPWTAGTRKDGYGVFWVPAGELGLEREDRPQAHRVAFYLIHGRWPLPEGLHGCDNPACCNALSPEHVHEGTHQRNMQEMVERGRFVQNLPIGAPRLTMRRFTDAQVVEFRVRRSNGAPITALAQEAGVASSAMWRLLNGITYADVEFE